MTRYPTHETPPRAPTASSVKCTSCGYNLTGVAIGGACPECGTAVDESIRPNAVTMASGFAVTSLILGIISMAVCGLLGPFAIIVGCLGLKDANDDRYSASTRGMAIAGIVLGVISTTITLMVIGFLVIASWY